MIQKSHSARAIYWLIGLFVFALSVVILRSNSNETLTPKHIARTSSLRSLDFIFRGGISQSSQHGHPDDPVFGHWGTNSYLVNGSILFQKQSIKVKFVNERPQCIIETTSGEHYLILDSPFDRCGCQIRVLCDGVFEVASIGSVPAELLDIQLNNERLQYSFQMSVLSDLGTSNRTKLLKVFNDYVRRDSRFALKCHCTDKEYDTCLYDLVSTHIRESHNPAFADGFEVLCRNARPDDCERTLQACYFGMFTSDKDRAARFLVAFYKACTSQGLKYDARIHAMRSLPPETLRWLGIFDEIK